MEWQGLNLAKGDLVGVEPGHIAVMVCLAQIIGTLHLGSNICLDTKRLGSSERRANRQKRNGKRKRRKPHDRWDPCSAPAATLCRLTVSILGLTTRGNISGENSKETTWRVEDLRQLNELFVRTLLYIGVAVSLEEWHRYPHCGLKHFHYVKYTGSNVLEALLLMIRMEMVWFGTRMTPNSNWMEKAWVLRYTYDGRDLRTRIGFRDS
jgi:hypothetical protein